MTPGEVVERLRGMGVALRAERPVLHAGPPSRLTEEAVSLLVAHKAELLDWLEGEADRRREADEAYEALEEWGRMNPVGFPGEPVVLVRFPGFGVKAMSAEDADALCAPLKREAKTAGAPAPKAKGGRRGKARRQGKLFGGGAGDAA